MGTKGNARKSALIVIDVQNGVMASGWEADRVITNVGKLVESARSCDLPVVWVQHQAEDMPRDSDAWQIVPSLEPKESEAHVYKEYCDSFANTNLEQILADDDIGHVVICGAQSNACVRATTYRAAGEGYDVTLVSDAHTTESFEWDGVTIDAEKVVTDLNLSMMFSDWPNQDVQTATTEEVMQF